MNKQTLSGLLLAALASFCLPASAEPLAVTVIVKGLASNTGGIVVSAYNDPDKWFSEDVAARERLELTENTGEEVSIQLSLEPGEYALTAYHDENDNKKLDSNFIGIPSEPTGLSNNHRPRFGPPKYKKAAIDILDNQQVIEITLQ